MFIFIVAMIILFFIFSNSSSSDTKNVQEFTKDESKIKVTGLDLGLSDVIQIKNGQKYRITGLIKDESNKTKLFTVNNLRTGSESTLLVSNNDSYDLIDGVYIHKGSSASEQTSAPQMKESSANPTSSKSVQVKPKVNTTEKRPYSQVIGESLEVGDVIRLEDEKQYQTYRIISFDSIQSPTSRACDTVNIENNMKKRILLRNHDTYFLIRSADKVKESVTSKLVETVQKNEKQALPQNLQSNLPKKQKSKSTLGTSKTREKKEYNQVIGEFLEIGDIIRLENNNEYQLIGFDTSRNSTSRKFYAVDTKTGSEKRLLISNSDPYFLVKDASKGVSNQIVTGTSAHKSQQQTGQNNLSKQKKSKSTSQSSTIQTKEKKEYTQVKGETLEVGDIIRLESNKQYQIIGFDPNHSTTSRTCCAVDIKTGNEARLLISHQNTYSLVKGKDKVKAGQTVTTNSLNKAHKKEEQVPQQKIQSTQPKQGQGVQLISKDTEQENRDHIQKERNKIMAMTKLEARKFIESEEVQAPILHYTTLAFDRILFHFFSQPELGYIRASSEEIDNLSLSDFFELFYTNDDTFVELYNKQTNYVEASLSKHFRSAIGFIVVSAVEDYLEVEQHYLWNNEEQLYEECLAVAARRYFELMSYNDLYSIGRDYPKRMMKLSNFLQQ